jgi:UDP-glucose 4-epimerase
MDNMSNSIILEGEEKPESVLRVEKLTGRTAEFVKGDLLSVPDLQNVFRSCGPFEAVIHFAALKAVGESTKLPLMYYKNNVTGSINLLEVMAEFGCKRIVFSSSATVYGDPLYLPMDENHPTGDCTNPYGQTKCIVEHIMQDSAAADPELKAIMLRYFNPVGAHPSGEIGEDPLGIPNNLMPFIAQVSVGRRKMLSVFGNDYDTPDGTGVRDYIHVMDLATGHVAALKKMDEPNFKGWKPYNLGTGNGCSVMELVRAYEKASGVPLPYEIVSRRNGDVATSYASSKLAETELEWKATKTIEDMCADTWKWQTQNPHGFAKS